MDIDLGQDVVFKVSYNSSIYELREPTVGEMQGLKKKMEDDEMALIKFLANLGLPESVGSGMPVTKIKKLVDAMVGAISEKK